MAQQLPLVQIPMPQGQQQSYNLPPLQMPQPQAQVPDFVNNPNIDINTKRQMLNQINQPQVIADVSPQSMAVAGANRQGIDWAGLLGNLGSYVAAAGSAYGTGANPSQGLLNAANATQKHTQNIRQYDAMAPHFQQMGYDVSGYDPRRGGAGLTATPEKMIELESLIDQRKTNAAYRQMMAEARMQQAAQTAGTKGVTIGTLRMMSPQFKKMIDAQYGFGNGQNLKLLDQVVPASMVQGYMPGVTKTNNMVYSGGLHSSQNKTGRSDIYHHSNNTGGGSRGNGKGN